MFKKAIITGIAGQDGAYLAKFLLAKKYRVIGIDPSLAKKILYRLDYFGIAKKLTLVEGDVLNGSLIKRILTKYQPAEFYNLAGQSSVARSWERPEETFQINAMAVLRMLRLIQKFSPRTRFFQCSSAEIFGQTDSPVTESYLKFNPVNPYGISKLSAHLAVKSLREHYGLFAVNGVLFNHESPLRPDFMVTKKIVKGALRIATGSQIKLGLGDIAVRRDWGFAGDFVEAMWSMLNQKKPRDFIICTGKSFPLKKFIEEVFRYLGIKQWQKYIVVDRTLFRKGEIRNMRGSSRRIKKELGWKPKIGFKQLVKIMVDYELARVNK